MSGPVGDDECILRHVTSGKRVSHQDFKLREGKGETGLSVSRNLPTLPAALVARVSRSPADSRVAAARVGDVRALGLEVVPDPLPDDPGHALIVSGAVPLSNDLTVRERLRSMFHLLPPGA